MKTLHAKIWQTLVAISAFTFSLASFGAGNGNGNGNGNSKGAKAGGGDLFLTSAIHLDRTSGDITLPLYEGRHAGAPVWYIVTESSNQEQAERLGVNFAPKLANALGTAAVQNVRFVNAQTGRPSPARPSLKSQGVVLDFDGTVDFSPERMVVPGATGFPPVQFRAGAVGDALYSPLITLGDGIVLNASQVANRSGTHDALLSIDYARRQVTLDQFRGFYEFDEIFYLHQEGSIELVAAVEGSTWAPNLNYAPGLGSNDPGTSARSAIIPIVNGALGVNNPERQGLQSALLGEGDPLNVTQEEPGFEDGVVLYSPMWDIHLVVWTDAAIAAGERRRLIAEEEIVPLFTAGLVVSGDPAGTPNASLGGLRAINAISNCPISINLGPAR